MSNEPKPATSVHLTWHLPPTVQSNSYEYYNEVTVHETTKCTYFCPIQFYPGGYCGIQERAYDKIGIFSMWNQPHCPVDLHSKGDGVVVTDFGGEGTGLKSIKSIDWSLGEKVGFKVRTEFKNPFWLTTCEIHLQNQVHVMTTYKQRGPNPMQRFISFVEDYGRFRGACGYKQPRSCTFSGTTCRMEDKCFSLSSATFSKVENGCDKFAMDYCSATSCLEGLQLSTGGDKCNKLSCGTEFHKKC